MSATLLHLPSPSMTSLPTLAKFGSKYPSSIRGIFVRYRAFYVIGFPELPALHAFSVKQGYERLLLRGFQTSPDWRECTSTRKWAWKKGGADGGKPTSA
jgi:hypothetical protein